MKTCVQGQRLTPFLLGDLPPAEAAAFRRHLASCPECQATARELEPVLSALKDALAPADADLRLDPARRARVLATAPVPRPVVHRLPARRLGGRVIRWVARPRSWLAIAAGLVLFIGVALMLAPSFMRARRSLPHGETSQSSEMLCFDMAQSAPDTTFRRSYGGRATRQREATASGTVTDARFSAAPAAPATPAPEAAVASAPMEESAKPANGPASAAARSPEGGARAFYKMGDKVAPSPVERPVAHGHDTAAPGRMAGSGGDALARMNTDANQQQDAYAYQRQEESGSLGLPGASSVSAQNKEWSDRKGSRRNAAASGKPQGKQRRASEFFSVDAAAEESSASRGLSAGDGAIKALADTDGEEVEIALEKQPQTRTSKTWGLEEAARREKEQVQAVNSLVAASDLTAGERTAAGAHGASREAVAALPQAEQQAAQQLAESDRDLGAAVLEKRAANKAERMETEIRSSGERAKARMALQAAAAEKPRPMRRLEPVAFNPFVSVSENCLSTFGIGVDTASYTLLRQALQSGALPDPEQVRTEEIVNAFDYGDEAPGRATFRIVVEGAPSPFGAPGLSTLRIGIKGRRIGREEQRPAMLTFLVDTSGSMSEPDRIGRARTALKLLLDRLAPNDRIQLIAFDDRARLVLPPTPARDKKAVLAVFDGLQCTGSTNLEDGMRQAYTQAARAFVPGGENRVILISDGVANMGADDAQEIVQQVSAFRRQGVTCSIFGVGNGAYNDAMLADLANKGGGVYRFLDTDEEVRRVFVDDLAATLNTIARDVKIQVEWSPEAVRRYRQLGYESRALKAEQFRDDRVEAGEVGSGQSVSALYQLERLPQAGRQALGTVRVRYRRMDTGAVEEIARPIAAADLAPSIQAARPAFRLAVCAAAFAELLRGSPFAGGATYEDVARLLRPVALEMPLDTRVKELLTLVDTARGFAGP